MSFNYARTNSRRGVSLPLNFIIIAAILVIVLVVVLAIFGQRAAIFNESTSKECPADSGETYDDESEARDKCGSGNVVVYRPQGNEDQPWCCLPVDEVTQ